VFKGNLEIIFYTNYFSLLLPFFLIFKKGPKISFDHYKMIFPFFNFCFICNDKFSQVIVGAERKLLFIHIVKKSCLSKLLSLMTVQIFASHLQWHHSFICSLVISF